MNKHISSHLFVFMLVLVALLFDRVTVKHLICKVNSDQYPKRGRKHATTLPPLSVFNLKLIYKELKTSDKKHPLSGRRDTRALLKHLT